MNGISLTKTSSLVLNKQMVIAMALSVGVMTLGSKVSFMIPMFLTPITLQTFALMFLGTTLKKEQALMGMVAWVSLVAIGLPLASGVSLAVLSPSFGFILSFIPAVYLIALMNEKINNKSVIKTMVINSIFAIGLVYVIGYTYMAVYMGLNLEGVIPFISTYLPADVLSMIVVSFLAIKLKK